MELSPTRKKMIIAGAIVGGLLLIWLLLSLTNAGKVTMTLRVSPMDSQLTVDGKPTAIGKLTLAKGKHTFVATRKHFDTLTLIFDTANLSATKEAFMILEANDDEGRAYIANNVNEQIVREEAGGAAFNLTQENILAKYPFVTELPYSTVDYTIDYQTTSKSTIKLVISVFIPNSLEKGTPEYNKEVDRLKVEALAYLRDKKISTTKIPTEFYVNEDTPIVLPHD
jgi:hypothetical protein